VRAIDKAKLIDLLGLFDLRLSAIARQLQLDRAGLALKRPG